MASFSAGTTFTDGVANDVTAAKLAALVNNATPTSGLIQDRTAETIIATNDAFLFGDASDSNNLKRITVANFTQTLPTAKVTTGTIETATLGTTTGTAASFSGDLTIADKIVHSGDTNTAIRFPAADTVTVETAGAERVRVDSLGNVGIGTATTDDAGLTITKSVTRDNGWDAKLALQSTGSDDYPVLVFSGCSSTSRYGAIVQTASTSGNSASSITSTISFDNTSSTQGLIRFFTNNNVGTTSPSERLRIDSSGNVGIGVTSPLTALHIKNNGVLQINNPDGTRNLQIFNDSQFAEIKSSVDPIRLNTIEDIRFLTGSTPTERLRIDSSGNVGIGITSPNQKLVVVGASSDTETIRVITGSNSGIQQTTGIGFGFTSGATNPSALIQAEEFDIVDARASIVFSTNNTNTDVAPTERMRISSAGNVSIGTATALSTLHVHGNFTLSNTTTATSAGTGGLSKPATYAGYLTVSINGTSRKIPYYAT